MLNQDERTFDSIVIGSGISGGWAAKELCEKGLKTLVLERGRNVVHNKDYPTATKNIWEIEKDMQTELNVYSIAKMVAPGLIKYSYSSIDLQSRVELGKS